MTKIREAVAIFDDPQKLEAALSDLQGNGIDRSQLSLLADEALLATPNSDAYDLADNPRTPRETPISDTDVRQERVLHTSMAAAVAGLAAAGFAVATGGSAAIAAIVAALAAGGAGAAGAALDTRLAKNPQASRKAQLARGGIVLWVRTPDTETERSALDVLRRYSAEVQIHDVPDHIAAQRVEIDRGQ